MDPTGKNRYQIRILNISVGIGELKERYKEQVLREYMELLWDHNILVVCAAGNAGPEDGSISEMASSRKVLTVGCHDGRYCKNDPKRCETYSGRGRKYDVIRKPDIVAPGTRILSCNAFWKIEMAEFLNLILQKRYLHGNPHCVRSGSTGTTKYPRMSNEEFLRRVALTATDLGEPWNKQGFGMLNVRRLLENK